MDESSLKFVDKYHPKTIDDVILNEAQKLYFKASIKNRRINNMTLAGPPGIGKTTICSVLAKAFDVSVLFIPCGIKGTIDIIRGEVKTFTEALDLEGRPKVVILDEADSLTGGNGDSNAQKALRSLMGAEENQDVSWWLTCNYPNKIIAPIISRCPIIHLSYTVKDLTIRLLHILKSEGIKFTDESLLQFAQIVLKKHYPDIRKILTLLQNACVDGELKTINDAIDIDETYKSFLNNLVALINDNKSNLRSVMAYVEGNSAAFAANYLDLEYRLIKHNGIALNPIKGEKLCDFIYKTQNAADPLVMFTGFICVLLNRAYNI